MRYCRGAARSGRVIEVLSRLVSAHGAPRYLRSDNGPEFVSRAILRWLHTADIDTALNDPGKPWQNGADESFNGKFRDECLSLEWFRNRTEAAQHLSSGQHLLAVVKNPHEAEDQRPRTPADSFGE